MAGPDRTSIRGIARRAGVKAALVHHHGGTKEARFLAAVARPAEELARLRRDAPALSREAGPPDLLAVQGDFIRPYLDRMAETMPRGPPTSG